MRRVNLILIFSERAASGGVGCASADHERDWPPCKVVFFGLATNTLHVRNNNNNNVAGSIPGSDNGKKIRKKNSCGKH